MVLICKSQLTWVVTTSQHMIHIVFIIICNTYISYWYCIPFFHGHWPRTARRSSVANRGEIIFILPWRRSNMRRLLRRRWQNLKVGCVGLWNGSRKTCWRLSVREQILKFSLKSNSVFVWNWIFWLASIWFHYATFFQPFSLNWTHSWITSWGQLKPKMVLQWTCWSGGLSHEVFEAWSQRMSPDQKIVGLVRWFISWIDSWSLFLVGYGCQFLGGVYGFSLFWRSSSPSWMDQTL